MDSSKELARSTRSNNDLGLCELSNQLPVDLDEEEDMNSSIYHWPDTFLEKVLKHIAHCPGFDQQNLLNCRLVAVQWNEMIKNTSEIMKQIKFPITDAKEFLNLPIVKSGKIKSVIIKNTSPLDLESDSLDCFNKVLSNAVRVEFAFSLFSYDSGSNAPSQLFQFILKNCTNLEKLVLSKDPIPIHRNVGILRDINPETIIAACNKINYLSVNLKGFVKIELDAAGLTTLVLSLPKLQHIKLYGICDRRHLATIFAGLCEYIRKFSEALEMKKLSLNTNTEDDWNQTGCEAELIKLVNLCLQNHVLVDFEKLPTINLRTLDSLDLAELPGKAALRRPLFPIKFNGVLILTEDEEFTNLDRLNSLNIGRLLFVFGRQVLPGELNWIGSLQNLDRLSLVSIPPLPLRILSPVSVRELEDSFTAGVPSLQTLDIERCERIFESTHIHLWPQYFPNLTEIRISFCKITSQNFLSQLTVLESLSQLFLSHLTNITDLAFTTDCVNRFANEEGKPPSLAPAITCFKSLKLLHLDLLLLTDSCVSNGIAKCKSLDKLVITNCRNMTKNCIGLMQCEVKFI